MYYLHAVLRVQHICRLYEIRISTPVQYISRSNLNVPGESCMAFRRPMIKLILPL